LCWQSKIRSRGTTQLKEKGHFVYGNNYFDLHQQQDLAQELGDGDYDLHNHSNIIQTGLLGP